MEQGNKKLTAPEALDIPLFIAAEELFRSTCRRRVRVKALKLSCASAVEQHGQLDLFASAAQNSRRDTALQDALDGLRSRYGSHSLRWGRSFAGAAERHETISSSAVSDLSEYRYHTDTRRGG